MSSVLSPSSSVALSSLGLSLSWGDEPGFRSLDGNRLASPPAPRVFFPDAIRDSIPDPVLEDDGKLRRLIPASLVDRVKRFPAYQCRYLLGLHRMPALEELASDNPVLAFCVANYDQFTDHSPEAFDHYVTRFSRMPRKKVCDRLGFPGKPAMAKLFQKIDPAAAHPSTLRLLRLRLEHQANLLQVLSHMPALHVGALGLCVLPEAETLVSPRLLKEVAEDEHERCQPAAAQNLTDIIAMRKDRGEPALGQAIVSHKRLLSLHDEECREYTRWLEHEEGLRRQREADLERQREEARAELARRTQEAKTKLKSEDAKLFPPPPFPGNDHIQPIITKGELRNESIQQNNCVATLGHKVARRNTYFYRVLKPRRATLQINYSRDRGWYRSQLREKNNCSPEYSVTKAVDSWLCAEQAHAGRSRRYA